MDEFGLAQIGGVAGVGEPVHADLHGAVSLQRVDFEISWHELALFAAKEAGVEASGLIRVDGGERRVTTLSSERGLILPPLEGAISRFIRAACALK